MFQKAIGGGVGLLPINNNTLRKFAATRVFHKHENVVNCMSISDMENYLERSAADNQMILCSAQ